MNVIDMMIGPTVSALQRNALIEAFEEVIGDVRIAGDADGALYVGELNGERCVRIDADGNCTDE
jgi:hypothetical protein